MEVNRNPHIMCFDLDDTLIMWNDEGDYTPNLDHIAEMRKAKRRGQYVRLWTRAPLEFAFKIINELGIESFIDSVENKPEFYWDDRPADHWMVRCYKGVNPNDR